MKKYLTILTAILLLSVFIMSVTQVNAFVTVSHPIYGCGTQCYPYTGFSYSSVVYPTYYPYSYPYYSSYNAVIAPGVYVSSYSAVSYPSLFYSNFWW